MAYKSFEFFNIFSLGETLVQICKDTEMVANKFGIGAQNKLEGRMRVINIHDYAYKGLLAEVFFYHVFVAPKMIRGG